MTRYFVIGTERVTRDQSNALRAWLEGQKGVGWWHWIDGLWLVVSSQEDVDVQAIRDQIREIAPKTRHLVMEVHPETWSGVGPKSEKRNMFSWLKRRWKK